MPAENVRDEHYSDEEVDRLRTILRKTNKLLQPSIPIQTRRETLERWAPEVAEDVRLESVSALGVPAEWVSTDRDSQITVLYLHGGGYSLGGLADVREFLSIISRASGCRVLSLDYRLAPEHPFPAAVEDAQWGYEFLLKSGVEPKTIIVLGESAGGGLALSLLMSLRDNGRPLPAGGITLSAWADLTMSGKSYELRAPQDPIDDVPTLEWSASAYCERDERTNPLISPIFGNFAGMPPLMLLVGTEEIVFDDTIEVDRKANAAGVRTVLDVTEGMFHCYPRFAAILRQGRDAVERMAEFMHQSVEVSNDA